VASTSKVFSMRHINRPTWMPAANIPSPLKWFLGLFSDFATSLILFQKDSPPRGSTSCVQISWNLANRKSVKSCVAYLTKTKTKFPVTLSLLLLWRSHPKSARTCGKQCTQSAKFHPNRFTSGGVTAERVTTDQTHHKVCAILGEATTSSPSKNSFWRQRQIATQSQAAHYCKAHSTRAQQ